MTRTPALGCEFNAPRPPPWRREDHPGAPKRLVIGAHREHRQVDPADADPDQGADLCCPMPAGTFWQSPPQGHPVAALVSYGTSMTYRRMPGLGLLSRPLVARVCVIRVSYSSIQVSGPAYRLLALDVPRRLTTSTRDSPPLTL